MQSSASSIQSNRLFGEHNPEWQLLERDARFMLQLPEHLDDQVFRILFAPTPAAHYFEVTVSEQCPKDAYSHLGKSLARLKINAAIVNIIHNRSPNAHLMLWQGAGKWRHLDIDFNHLSNFDREIIGCLRPGDNNESVGTGKINTLFQLIDGRKTGDSFFRTLRRRLEQLDHATDEEWHALVDLALKMVFLIFVQRKGWLNFDPYYLESKMNMCHERGLSIIQCFFKPLFARLEGTRVREPIPLGALPCLGGGLFRFDANCLPSVPNQWCLDLYRTLVSKHSFSLFESKAGRHIIGIGPEMLGHVFENLLFRKHRKNHGIFYTPPDVAERQVKSAFEAWLRNNNLQDNCKARSLALKNIRILDPSCGSGTYLVAAFQVLLEHRLTLESRHERYNGKLFNLKRTIMLENLYGVDINPIAVRLTEVRLWLNMIQDLEISEPGKAPALPNLQHHLRPGDFLNRHVPQRPERMQEWAKYNLLESLRKKFPSSSASRRNLLLRHIYRLEEELNLWLEGLALETAQQQEKERLSQVTLPGHDRAGQPLELPRYGPEGMPMHVMFSRVFLEKGFDLILGNPPWLSATSLSQDHKKAILRSLNGPPGLKLVGQVDTSLYFAASSLNLLKPGGHLGFLMPGKILQAQYAASLRAWLGQRTRIDYLFDYGIDHKLIFKADTFPLAIGVTLLPAEEKHQVLVEKRGVNTFESFHTPQSRMGCANGVWTLGTPREQKKLLETAWWPKLRDFPFNIRRGVVTGAKRIFVFDHKPSFIAPHRLRPLLRGRDIQPDGAAPKRWIYWPFDDGEHWIEKVNDQERQWLMDSGKCVIRGSRARIGYGPRQGGQWVLAWKYLARDWRPILYRGDWIPDQTTYYMTFDQLDTAWRFFAYFNTQRARYWLQQMAERGKDRFFFYYAHTCEAVPIPPNLLHIPMEIPPDRDLYLPGEAPSWSLETEEIAAAF